MKHSAKKFKLNLITKNQRLLFKRVAAIKEIAKQLRSNLSQIEKSITKEKTSSLREEAKKLIAKAIKIYRGEIEAVISNDNAGDSDEAKTRRIHSFLGKKLLTLNPNDFSYEDVKGVREAIFDCFPY